MLGVIQMMQFGFPKKHGSWILKGSGSCWGQELIGAKIRHQQLSLTTDDR